MATDIITNIENVSILYIMLLILYWTYFLWVTFVYHWIYQLYDYGMNFAVGSAEYAKANNIITEPGCENPLSSVRDESRELFQAILDGEFGDVFLEFFDTLHSIIKFFIVTVLPEWIYCHWLCWFVVFPFVLPVSIKMANRYKKYKCIRNHSRPNANHICVVNRSGGIKND